MERLQAELELLMQRLPNEQELRQHLANLVSIYPFNEYEYIIATLLAMRALTFEEYVELRDSYISRNLNLYIFEISSPRSFGDAWAQGHLKGLVPRLQKPSKHIDPDYSGQYDLTLDQIRIEVKASRVVDSGMEAPLYVKALDSDSKKDFWVNFQQIKPACCDVFVWISVWRDVIRYWVLCSREVAESPYYISGQHRGNVGEGQIHLRRDTIERFKDYEVRPHELEKAIRDAYARQLA